MSDKCQNVNYVLLERETTETASTLVSMHYDAFDPNFLRIHRNPDPARPLRLDDFMRAFGTSL